LAVASANNELYLKIADSDCTLDEFRVIAQFNRKREADTVQGL
jgi:hypothetical protein